MQRPSASRFTGRLVRRSLTTMVLAASLGPAATTAQRPASREPAEQGTFGALQWRSIGPLRGGRSIAVAGSAARPLEYFFGATGGGLWKTTDGGATWRPVTDGHIASSSVGAVAVAPSNPDVVYLGTGESEIRGDIIQGDGVYRSGDGGATWTHVGLDDSQAIAKIRVDPSNADRVYAAVFGHPYGPNDQRGVYRSSDGGHTWQRILFRDARAGAIDLAIDPANPRVLYASLWEAFRTSYSMSSGGPGSGLFKSVDGGDHWVELSRNPGLPPGVLGKIGLAVAGSGGRLYAQVEAEDGGFFRSDDEGATWSRVSDRRDLRQRAFYYSRVYVDPKAPDTVYVLNVNVHKSMDGGKTWTTLRAPHGDHHDLWIAPDDPRRMIEGNDGGANVSVNGGQTWTGQEYATGQFYHVITTAHIPYHVCGAQQDNSTACVSSQSGVQPGGSSGTSDRVFYSVGGGESGYIASDPRQPDVFFAGSYGGLITRMDRSTGQLRQINPYPDNPMGYSSEDIAERFQWTTPIVLSPTDSRVLYVGSQHVWRSTNEGQTWTRISPDLTRHDPSTMGPSGGPITKDQSGVETYATVFAIAPSPKDDRVIWTGSDDGLVFITRDGGDHWVNVTPPALPSFTRISLIDASPHRPGTAFVAANRYQADDFAPYVYRTDDFGATWTATISGIPSRDFAHAIREDPARQGLLYLGTEHGISVSFDNGDHWETLRQNLPDTPVHDIAITSRDLVIATHGRGLYVMDGIGPLRQWKEVSGRNLTLFRPDEVLRGLDRSLAIAYRLSTPAQTVTIDVLDGQSRPIRTFTGTAAGGDERRESQSEGEEESNRRPPDPKPRVTAGVHTVRWDLRYPGSLDFPGLIMWAASGLGPVAPPGDYAVRITADGVSATEPFVIRREPRLLAAVTDDDLAAQFALGIRIRDKVSAANAAVVRIRTIRPVVAERLQSLASAPRAAAARKALEAFARMLQTIEERLYQVRNQSSQDPLNYPIRLNNRLAALQGVVGSGDVRPTDQAVETFTRLAGLVDVQLAALDRAVATDRPAVNRLLATRRLPPLPDGASK